MNSGEQVLVIPTQVLRDAGMFHGLSRDVEHYWPRLLDPNRCFFMPRVRAEDDPTHKQLIPYVLLKHGDHVFHYTRGKGMGEKRLHGLRSVGIGGHINPVDVTMAGVGTPTLERHGNWDSRGRTTDPGHEHDLYRQGMLREVAEEVRIDTAYRTLPFGFINDDSTPVGQVHLGIVHLFELEAPSVQRREADVLNAGFAQITELVKAKDEFETWSQFVLTELMTTQLV
jgi:predicted NUDIX family phosphoesterase